MSSTIYFIQDEKLYTTNNGWDKKEKPCIPLMEFLEDVLQIRNIVSEDMSKKILRTSINDIENEINRLPSNMKTLGFTDLTMFKSLYDIE